MDFPLGNIFIYKVYVYEDVHLITWSTADHYKEETENLFIMVVSDEKPFSEQIQIMLVFLVLQDPKYESSTLTPVVFEFCKC